MSTESKPTEEKSCEGENACGCQEKEGTKTSRRDFLLAVGFGLNAIAAAMMGIPILGYLLSTFAKKYPLQFVSLGPISKFPEGTTRLASFKNPYNNPWDGQTADIPCWVRNINNTDFQIFAINCTHLGCPIRWFEESKLFMCPCHGGAFYENGEHAAGPPPRALYTYPFKVENNELFVQAGVMPTLGRTLDNEKAKQ